MVNVNKGLDCFDSSDASLMNFGPYILLVNNKTKNNQLEMFPSG